MSVVKNENIAGDLSERLYDVLAEDNDDEGRVCRDIPDEACHEQPLAFTYQLLAQTLTKIGDALISARLVLAWMLSALGSPAFFIALLVPVRESGSLLPQLLVARRLRELPLRKVAWIAGSLGQAMALVMMLPAVMFLTDAALGACVIALLAVFSVSRGICSVASKDVLGKTISRGRRGRLNGLAASASGAVTIIVALVLTFHEEIGIELSSSGYLFVFLIAAAALIWLISTLIYARVPEVPGATEGGGSAFEEAVKNLSLLASDNVLREFVIARALAISVGISIPYIVILVQRQSGNGFGDLGALMLAEGFAAMLSGAIWGKLSDKASHHVMAIAACASGLVMLLVVAAQLTNASLLGLAPLAGLVLFAAAVCHQGIRIARKTYLVDIATGDNRATYVAVSNTAIGILVAAAGIFGVVDLLYGTNAVLVLLALLAFAAAGMSFRLQPA